MAPVSEKSKGPGPQICVYCFASMRPALFILLLLTASGCTQSLSRQIVQPQNLDSPFRGTDATPQQLSSNFVSRQLRVPVGPPGASLSVWILDPLIINSQVTAITSNDGRVKFQLPHDPATQPATAPYLRPPRATLFLLHGIGDHKELLPYQVYALNLRALGFRVILVDLRGHGRSTGDFLTYGVTETHDLAQVLDALEARNEITGRVGVIGASYGAAVAIQWAGIDPRIKAVVAISPFSSLREAAQDAAPFVLGNWKFLFSRRDIDDAVTRGAARAHFNANDASPLAAIRKTSAPVLLIHGKKDDLLLPANSQRLHDAAPDHSRLVLVDNGDHIRLWLTAYELIHRESVEWFRRYLMVRPSATQATSRPR